MNREVIIFGDGLVSQGIQKIFNEDNNNITLKVYGREEFASNSINSLKLFIKRKEPEAIILAIAATSGIVGHLSQANEIQIENQQINEKLLQILCDTPIHKLYNFVPGCVYPSQPENRSLNPRDLGSGTLEPSSELFAKNQIERMQALGEIAGGNNSWINLIVTNVIGVRNRKNKTNCHVLPALIDSISNAKSKRLKKVSMPGSGSTVRDFIWNQDLGMIMKKLLEVDLINREEKSILNIAGTGPVTIEQLSKIVTDILDYTGEILFEEQKSLTGTRYKLLQQSESINRLDFALTPLVESIKKIVVGK
jgi:GDP-L-fucose synthase